MNIKQKIEEKICQDSRISQLRIKENPQSKELLENQIKLKKAQDLLAYLHKVERENQIEKVEIEREYGETISEMIDSLKNLENSLKVLIDCQIYTNNRWSFADRT